MDPERDPPFGQLHHRVIRVYRDVESRAQHADTGSASLDVERSGRVMGDVEIGFSRQKPHPAPAIGEIEADSARAAQHHAGTVRQGDGPAFTGVSAEIGVQPDHQCGQRQHEDDQGRQRQRTRQGRAPAARARNRQGLGAGRR